MESHSLIIKGAKENNLKNIDIIIPKNKITVFTGVSGSGKSSLVFKTIAAESQRLLNETYSSFIQHRLPQYKKPDVDSIQNLNVSMVIDQKRLVGNARSTVGTMTDIYTQLRLMFSRIGTPFSGYATDFSFNNPKGMCTYCQGLGKTTIIDIDALLDKNKSLNEGAIKFPTFEPEGWRWTRYVYSGLFDNDKKLKDYSEEEWYNLLYLDNIKLPNADKRFPKTGIYEGIVPRFERSFIDKESKEIQGKNGKRFKEVTKISTCTHCNGSRLNDNVLKCKINGYNIADCCQLEIVELLSFIKTIHNETVAPLLLQLEDILQSIIDIGLGYLNLHREITTLSGGEAQRLKLVRHLKNSLTDLIYIFDEPSVGLHPHDVTKLNNIFINLKEKGNTVLIIEHDTDVIAIADNIVDIGPHSGTNGGEICYMGDYKGLKASNTLTGQYLRKEKILKKSNIDNAAKFICLNNLTTNNLKNINITIPLHYLTAITGVAGSGKSSLTKNILKNLSNVVYIDQSPIHSSSRSSIMTYLNIAESIRKEIANTNSISPNLLNNNSVGGCPLCKGKGIIKTDLAFMETVETICEQCSGTGFTKEALSYKYVGYNISEIMRLTVDQVVNIFKKPMITEPLLLMKKVGLSYLSLGRTLDTLSGGELQRLKLAKELEKRGNVYLFDEPTTGLHGSDIEKLIKLFDHLIADNNTVIIIEHNLDIISQSDWIIDLGLGGGSEGGNIIYQGITNGIINKKRSLTGKYLKNYINH
ncbi:ATP-binding cassette domain-containing protein [Myroides injenensis]|uniref:ATP-binding cassette domain-containing protein n=1 Tax=Myroides injenensis TaxID=1183151 RepID=UPI00226DF39F|nr:ATP-binding cassette domain-containing protein [Myroides injenensis]